MIKHQPDGIEEILDDCTIALTSRTEDDIKITSFDERLMDIPKLKAALNSYILEETLRLIDSGEIPKLKTAEEKRECLPGESFNCARLGYINAKAELRTAAEQRWGRK